MVASELPLMLLVIAAVALAPLVLLGVIAFVWTDGELFGRGLEAAPTSWRNDLNASTN